MTTYATCACGAELNTERAAIEHAKICRGQGLPRGWTLADYTRAVERSTRAYNADQAQEARRERERKP